jgi:hypothetical protein
MAHRTERTGSKRPGRADGAHAMMKPRTQLPPAEPPRRHPALTRPHLSASGATSPPDPAVSLCNRGASRAQTRAEEAARGSERQEPPRSEPPTSLCKRGHHSSGPSRQPLQPSSGPCADLRGGEARARGRPGCYVSSRGGATTAWSAVVRPKPMGF